MYLLIKFLTIGNFIDTIGDQIFVAFMSCVVCIAGAWIFVRDKVLKNEIKTDHMTQYIDHHVRLLENKILELQQDIADFKEINKETSRALAENTVAIRELKTVLTMLKEQLNLRRKNNFDNED